jgi:signal transduction histidine kinase/ActR/RegA family two-component response regulator
MQASVDTETGQRGFLLTNDARFLEPYESGRATAVAQIERLRELTGDDADLSERVGRAREHLDRALGSLATPLGRTQSPSELRRTLDVSKAHMDALRTEVAALLRAVEQKVDHARALERRNTDTLYLIGGLLAVLTLLAVALTVWALRWERKSWRAAYAALSEANEAAENAHQRAHASDLAKTRFLAVASHDMRQPLHALTLYLSALERRVEGAEARDIIKKMDRATQSMVGMFSTLLDLARIQAGVVKAEPTNVRLQDVIDRIVAEHPDSVVEAAPTMLAAHTDPLLLERLLRNLVSNAIKHGGGHTRINVVETDGEVEVSVADDGPGIKPEDHERIFEEFARGERRADGLGLGLAIVSRIADMLDTTIRLVSAPGEGACFIVRMPAAEIEDAQALPAEDTRTLEGASILVVDDDTLAREAVAGMLSDFGADVRAAEDEATAASAIDEGFAPRLLVMDLRIGGELAGVDIAQRLRDRVAPAPNIIIVTGDTGPEAMSQLQAAGFQWLIKPVHPPELSRAAAAQLSAA